VAWCACTATWSPSIWPQTTRVGRQGPTREAATHCSARWRPDKTSSPASMAAGAPFSQLTTRVR